MIRSMGITTLGDYIIITIALIWLIVAAVSDIKKREVPNWLSFSLIAIILGIRVLASILSWQFSYLLYGLAGLILVYAISNVFYYTRMFGGGDAKLLIGLGAAFGTNPTFMPLGIVELPFIINFLLNTLLVGAFYGVIYSIALALKNRKAFTIEFRNIAKGTERIRVIFLVFIGIFLLIITKAQLYSLLPLIFILIIFPYLYIFIKSVEDACMLKLLPSSKLTEGDWIAEEIKIGNRVIKMTAEGLTPKDILLIKKAKKKILIKQGIPFVPVFLIAALISVFAGNVFIMLAELLV